MLWLTIVFTVYSSIPKSTGVTPKQVMLEQTLDWCRRETDGVDDLYKVMRKKLGKNGTSDSNYTIAKFFLSSNLFLAFY
jgi:hypothetical protein